MSAGADVVAVPASVADVAPSIRTATSSPRASRSGSSASCCAASGPAQPGIRAAGTLDEDLLHPSDALLIALARDPLDDVDQPLDALALDLLRNLLGHGHDLGGALPGAVDECESAVVPHLLHDLERLAEVVLGLPREADDDVGGEREIGDRAPQPLDEREVALPPVRPPHARLSTRDEPD